MSKFCHGRLSNVARPTASRRLCRPGILLPVLFGLGLSFSVRADTRDDVIAASDHTHTVLRKAIADEDSGALASLFTEDGAIIDDAGRKIQGRTTIRTSAALLFMTMGGGEAQMGRRSVSVVNDQVYETGWYRLKRPSDSDGDDEYAGRYVVVWGLEAGSWKLATVIGLR